jgi:23S rRNA (cytidine1920-2'-O)/16S rRNA (cytidine1409-2'-O)-methyltransferase
VRDPDRFEVGPIRGESRVSAMCNDWRVAVTSRARRVRLDQLLVDRGLAPSRSRAQALVLAGKVRVGEGDAARGDRKPGDLVDPSSNLQVDQPAEWVSRGAHKLLAALDAFRIDPMGQVALDVGASTGGFTDVLLRRGARRVYALDVGRGQLAERLRADGRVVSLERTNARDLTATTLPEAVDLAVIDVAFISLGLILGPVRSTLRADESPIIALVKPQFEAGRAEVKGGVVRDPVVHRSVIGRVAALAADLGLGTRDVIASPIQGPEGNREFLALLRAGPGARDLDARIATAVDAAWRGAMR